jgi:hypothetical protein
MSKSKNAGKSAAPPAVMPALPWQTAPDGSTVYAEPAAPPKANPLTAEHYVALQNVIERAQGLGDAIARAAHVGLNVDAHAAATASHYAIAQRILALYPPPSKSPLEL